MDRPDAGVLFGATSVGIAARHAPKDDDGGGGSGGGEDPPGDCSGGGDDSRAADGGCRTGDGSGDGSGAGGAGDSSPPVEWRIPRLFARRSNGWALPDPILSIAPTRVGLPLHNHGSAWEAVVVGKKLVVVIPPLPGPIPSEVIGIMDQAHLFVGSPWAAVRDVLERLWPTLRPKVCVLGPGDAIFLPCNHYHLTLNIGDTVAVGGVLDAMAVKADRCKRDVYATASSIIAAPLGPSPSPPPREAACPKEGTSGEGECGNNDSNDYDDPAAAAKRKSDRAMAGKLLLFSVEAALKWGVLLAHEDKLHAAVAHYTSAANRYTRLHNSGALGATPLAVILEVLAKYCASLAPAAALEMALTATRHDPCNPSVQSTLAQLDGQRDGLGQQRPKLTTDDKMHPCDANESLLYRLKSVQVLETSLLAS